MPAHICLFTSSPAQAVFLLILRLIRQEFDLDLKTLGANLYLAPSLERKNHIWSLKLRFILMAQNAMSQEAFTYPTTSSLISQPDIWFRLLGEQKCL
ncbi:MAG: hypothetical protein CMP47_14325 [Rickettsiales bacterium]|nr:hypothetical protein [Rickettsiales bacterium]